MEDGILISKFRLPTEAEWEYAAKADENREFNNLRADTLGQESILEIDPKEKEEIN